MFAHTQPLQSIDIQRESLGKYRTHEHLSVRNDADGDNIREYPTYVLARVDCETFLLLVERFKNNNIKKKQPALKQVTLHYSLPGNANQTLGKKEEMHINLD